MQNRLIFVPGTCYSWQFYKTALKIENFIVLSVTKKRYRVSVLRVSDFISIPTLPTIRLQMKKRVRIETELN